MSSSSSQPPAYHDGRSTLINANHGRNSSASIIGTQWTEHQYTLTDSRGVPWAILMVRSRAISPSHLPSTFEGEDITGVFSLDLSREDSIKAVVVSVIGQMTTSATDVFSFLNLSQELWSIDMGDPNPQPGTTFSGRLFGHYEWPFSFTIPPTVELNDASGTPSTYRIPPSFSERMARVHIQYQLGARLRRSKFRIDSQLGTVVAFTPFTHPGPFSEARQSAYRHNRPLAGPDQDHSGWMNLELVRIRGVVFSTRVVEAMCRLSLAKPLSYTRGTVIPCSMTVDCSDAQALDLLSMPTALDVRLVRHISSGPADVSAGAGQSKYSVDFEETSQEIKSAVWWPSSDGPHRRILSGEIHLPKDLKPNCHIGKFELYYTVNMFSLKAVAFSPQEVTTAPLRTQTVEIVTAYASGPRPKIYSSSPPPGYKHASTSRPSTDISLFRE